MGCGMGRIRKERVRTKRYKCSGDAQATFQRGQAWCRFFRKTHRTRSVANLPSARSLYCLPLGPVYDMLRRMASRRFTCPSRLLNQVGAWESAGFDEFQWYSESKLVKVRWTSANLVFMFRSVQGMKCECPYAHIQLSLYRSH